MGEGDLRSGDGFVTGGGVACGNEHHPDGAWHDAIPLPMATAFGWSRDERRFRRNIRLWGCGCKHTRARCIHGDEINHVGGKRGHCEGCGAWLDELPVLCTVTGQVHPAKVTSE